MSLTSKSDSVRFSIKGQIVILANLRRQFNIHDGTRAIVEATPEGILLKPVTKQAIAQLRGILKRKPGDKPLSEEWAEHQAAEKALEEAKYAGRPRPYHSRQLMQSFLTRSRFGIFSLYALLGVLLSMFWTKRGSAQQNVPDIAAIFAEGEKYLNSMPALEMKYETTIASPISDTNLRTLKSDYDFTYSPPCFSFIRNSVSGFPALLTGTSIYSFDGERYQYRSPFLHLIISKDASKVNGAEAIAYCPLFFPYSFLDNGKDIMSLDQMRAPRLWADVIAESKIIGTNSIKGHPTITVLIAAPRRSGVTPHFTVEFATDLDYYPISYTVRSEAGGAKVSSEVMEVKYNGRKLLIPSLIQSTNFNADGKPDGGGDLIKVDVSSIKIGKGHKKQDFDVPFTDAATVKDQDLGIILKIPRANDE